MCLNSRQTKPTKATKDITVYKVVSRTKGPMSVVNIGDKTFEISEVTLKSGRGFVYNIGKLNTTKMDVRKDHYSYRQVGSQIEAAFHAFRTLKTAKANCGGLNVVIECKIPKGSEYFLGKNNGSSLGIASNQLIAVKIV